MAKIVIELDHDELNDLSAGLNTAVELIEGEWTGTRGLIGTDAPKAIRALERTLSLLGTR